MSIKTVSAVIAAVSLLAGQAIAAGSVTVSSAKGEVMVMGAKGAVAAKAGTSLKTGDRIVARGGQASLRYADGCAVTVQARTMVTVGAVSPCAGARGAVSVQPAEAAQWWNVGSLDAGTVLAFTGAGLLVGAVIYGVTDPTKCKGTLEIDGQCTVSP